MIRWGGLLLSLGCPRPDIAIGPGGDVVRPPEVSSSDVTATEEESVDVELTGRVDDGVFMDHELEFQVNIPSRWTAEPGPMGGNLRVAMTEVETGLRVEIWAFGGIALEPRSREDCVWTFQDSGGYRVLHLPDPVTVATCVPHEPKDPRVFGYLVVREAWTWQLEVHVPSTATLDSLHRGEAVLDSLRWSAR